MRGREAILNSGDWMSPVDGGFAVTPSVPPPPPCAAPPPSPSSAAAAFHLFPGEMEQRPTANLINRVYLNLVERDNGGGERGDGWV